MLSSQRTNQAFVYFSLCVFSTNCVVYLLEGSTFLAIVTKSAIYVPFFAIIYFRVLQKRFDRLRKLSHITFLFLIATIAIFESTDSLFGPGFALIGLYLMYKYRLMRKNPVLKAILFMGSLSSAIILSSGFQDGWAEAFMVIAFFLFFYAILFLGELDWINRYRTKLKEEHLIRKALKDVVGQPIDLPKLGFTKREMEIGRLIVGNRKTDKELAAEIFISPHTLRNHLKSMRAKTSTSNTNELIDAIRWYYYKKVLDHNEAEVGKETWVSMDDEKRKMRF